MLELELTRATQDERNEQLPHAADAPPHPPPPAAADDPVLVPLADVDARDVAWLWPGRVARGKLTLLCGDPGVGKSMLALDLAARVTNGAAWPDGAVPCPAGSALLLCGEDDLADGVLPRLFAAAAALNKV